MVYSITPNQEVGKVEDNVPDRIMLDLIDEILDRRDYLQEHKDLLDNAPLQDEFQVDESQSFNGLEQLRNMSRNNYAKLIVSATTDRLGIIGFRTAVDRDESGDLEAMRAFERDDMAAKGVEAMGLSCAYRTSYLLVDPFAKRQSVIPPNNGAVIHDRYGEPVAALTIIRDRFMERDLATLYLRDVNSDTGEAEGPVYAYIASRDIQPGTERSKPYSGLTLTNYDTEVPLKGHLKNNWVWWKRKRVEGERIPVTALPNKDGKSEFEDHVDVINRLNHMIFQRVIIATMQAFRQRAVIGDFPDKDPHTGAKIDYEELFASGPAQMWTLPEGSTFWESTPPSFQDILESVKADTRDLASQTYTPMSYFSDAATNSAEGAALQRENYISKIEDRRSRFEPRWKRHVSILFEHKGDEDRSDITELEVIWKAVQVESLNNRVSAFASMRQNDVALSTALREAMGMSPTEIRRAVNEKIEENLTKTIQDAMNKQTPLERSSLGQSGGQNAQTNAQAATNRPAPKQPNGGEKK